MRYPHIRRWEKEDAAVSAITDYCRAHYRAFDVSYSTSEMAAWPLVGWDSNIQLTTAARIAPNLPGSIVSVVRGRSVYDVLKDPAAETAKVQQRNDLWRALHASINPAHQHRVNPEHYSPLVSSGIGKAEIVDDIPQDLLRLCWSCRVPVALEGGLQCCGECTPCQHFNALLKERSLSEQFPNLCADSVTENNGP